MVFIPETLMKVNVLSPTAQPWIYFIIGAGEFAVNFYLFWWAVAASRSGSRALSETG